LLGLLGGDCCGDFWPIGSEEKPAKRKGSGRNAFLPCETSPRGVNRGGFGFARRLTTLENRKLATPLRMKRRKKKIWMGEKATSGGNGATTSEKGKAVPIAGKRG